MVFEIELMRYAILIPILYEYLKEHMFVPACDKL